MTGLLVRWPSPPFTVDQHAPGYDGDPYAGKRPPLGDMRKGRRPWLLPGSKWQIWDSETGGTRYNVTDLAGVALPNNLVVVDNVGRTGPSFRLPDGVSVNGCFARPGEPVGSDFPAPAAIWLPVVYGPAAAATDIAAAVGTASDQAARVLRAHLGDGADGALDFDGTTTVAGAAAPAGGIYFLSRDLQATTIRVRSGATVRMNGFRMLARTSVTIDAGGVVTASGANATSTAGGSTTATGTVGAGTAGATGVVGNGAASSALGTTLGGRGGASGAGATGTASNGGVPTNPLASLGSAGVLTQLPWAVMARGLTTAVFGGGTGGASGGGDGTNPGGSGGGGGGVVVIGSPAIVNNGTISAKGGNGWTPTAGNCGGGSGGGGGMVLLTCVTYSGTAPDVTSGSGGLKSGTGGNAFGGSAGTVVTNILT